MKKKDSVDGEDEGKCLRTRIVTVDKRVGSRRNGGKFRGILLGGRRKMKEVCGNR